MIHATYYQTVQDSNIQLQMNHSSSDLCPPSPPPSSPVSKNSKVSFLKDIIHSPPPSSPNILTTFAQEHENNSLKSKRTLSFTSCQKKKKKKKSAVVYWKLTTMTSPDFSLSRLTERQQLALIRKKEELGLLSDELPTGELTKLLSPYLMDQMEGEYHAWARKNRLDEQDLSVGCPIEMMKPAISFQIKRSKKCNQTLISSHPEKTFSDINYRLPPPTPTPIDTISSQTNKDLVQKCDDFVPISWKSSLPFNSVYTDTIHQYHYNEIHRWVMQLFERFSRSKPSLCCSLLEQSLQRQLETERTISLDFLLQNSCKHIDHWRISSLNDLLARQRGERTILQFFN